MPHHRLVPGGRGSGACRNQTRVMTRYRRTSITCVAMELIASPYNKVGLALSLILWSHMHHMQWMPSIRPLVVMTTTVISATLECSPPLILVSFLAFFLTSLKIKNKKKNHFDLCGWNLSCVTYLVVEGYEACDYPFDGLKWQQKSVAGISRRLYCTVEEILIVASGLIFVHFFLC